MSVVRADDNPVVFWFFWFLKLVIPLRKSYHFEGHFQLSEGRIMSIALPLDQMTIAEKLEAMESLWADLSKRPAELPSPDWRRDVLAERKRLSDHERLSQ
jgi:hypothetical protein